MFVAVYLMCIAGTEACTVIPQQEAPVPMYETEQDCIKGNQGILNILRTTEAMSFDVMCFEVKEEGQWS